MRILLSSVLAAVLAQSAAQPQAPQPPVTFKVEVNYVEIDASVTDAQGNFVRTLTRDDFQIVEDGKPQALTAFSMVDIPVTRPDPPLFSRTAIPPDVVSNRAPFEGRVLRRHFAPRRRRRHERGDGQSGARGLHARARVLQVPAHLRRLQLAAGLSPLERPDDEGGTGVGLGGALLAQGLKQLSPWSRLGRQRSPGLQR